MKSISLSLFSADTPTSVTNEGGLKPAEARAYRSLNKATLRFSSTMRDVMLAGTDEWIPKDRAEFFSNKGIQILCRHTNAESAFGVNGEPTITYVAAGAREYLSALHEGLNAASNKLDSDTYRAASAVESAILLKEGLIYSSRVMC